MSSMLPGSTISAILRHDSKVTSYKIALLRAINDVVLAYPNMTGSDERVAIPLRLLADRWIAYYWPFADAHAPILQGRRSQLNGKTKQDISFRRELAQLYAAYAQFLGGTTQPSDGAVLVADLRVERLRQQYPEAILSAYAATVDAIVDAVENPIHYAGPRDQEWSVFPRPVRARNLPSGIISVPGTLPTDKCLLVPAALWTMFRDVSLWVEALCVHEWSLFTERVTEGTAHEVNRGEAYSLLTAHPASRRPLTWERNHIEILLMEGKIFTCPWTERPIVQGTSFDVDHLLPLAVYPMNEMWNLLPADPLFNQRTKRDRIPSLERLHKAEPHLVHAYTLYGTSLPLRIALANDTAMRFRSLVPASGAFPQQVANAAIQLIDTVATYRNLARF